MATKQDAIESVLAILSFCMEEGGEAVMMGKANDMYCHEDQGTLRGLHGALKGLTVDDLREDPTVQQALIDAVVCALQFAEDVVGYLADPR